MNLRDLQYLVALADTGHFRQAAEIVNVSQPTLSGQIRKLEETLGVALFERDSRNVSLTTIGEAVVKEARAVLAHADTIRDIANASRDPLAGNFRLGIIASLGPFLAPDLLGQLQHDAPRLEVIVQEALTDQLISSLRARELDAALIATTPTGDDLLDVFLFDEPFLLAHAPTDPLAAIEAPTLRDIQRGTLLLLAEGHCLRDHALSLCDSRSVDARVKATSLFTLMRLAALGLGTTLVPALAANFAHDLALRKLGGSNAHRSVRLTTRRNFSRMGALHVIASAARAVAEGHGLSTPDLKTTAAHDD
jgi:LysR family hydrogen peroxide-inducible transcriptional activator